MNVLDRIPRDSPIRDVIKSCLQSGPCLHVIPLYSNLLVSKRRFDNKYSWRVSCSGIEKYVFDQYPPTSGVKVCMRMIKAVRELFLADDRRKTHRSLQRKKRKPDRQRQESVAQTTRSRRGGLRGTEANPKMTMLSNDSGDDSDHGQSSGASFLDAR